MSSPKKQRVDVGFSQSSASLNLKNVPLDGHRRMKVRVVGAGYSGIYLGIRIPQRLRNIDLKIYEKNEGVGGTWWANRYPGMRLHWLSFTWKRAASRQLSCVLNGSCMFTFPRCCLRYSVTLVPVHFQPKPQLVFVLCAGVRDMCLSRGYGEEIRCYEIYKTLA